MSVVNTDEAEFRFLMVQRRSFEKKRSENDSMSQQNIKSNKYIARPDIANSF